jgi:biopolymer transport protein ExbD
MRRRPSRRHISHISHIDLTALVDVAFLLLAFFLMSSKFKPANMMEVNLPSQSFSMGCRWQISPMTSIIVTRSGATFLHFHEPSMYARILARAGGSTHRPSPHHALQPISGTEEIAGSQGALQRRLAAVGKHLLRSKVEARVPWEIKINELSYYLMLTKLEAPNMTFQIRADGDAAFVYIGAVVDALQATGINKFHLITALEQNQHHAIN